MAGLAGCRELCSNVIRVVGCREVRLVAGVACRRHGLELAVRAALVAGIAIDRSMGPRERELVVVLLNIPSRDLPSPHRVALLAIRTQLALVISAWQSWQR